MDGRLLKPNTAMDSPLLYFFTFALNGPLLYIRNNVRWSVAIEILQWRAIFEPCPLQLWPKMTYTLTQPMYKRRLSTQPKNQPAAQLNLWLILRRLICVDGGDETRPNHNPTADPSPNLSVSAFTASQPFSSLTSQNHRHTLLPVSLACHKRDLATSKPQQATSGGLGFHQAWPHQPKPTATTSMLRSPTVIQI